MAPKEVNKWTAEADRDLLLSMLAAQNAIAPQWAKVNEIMRRLGHSFSDSAVSQRWSKTVFKKFKEEHNIDDLGILAGSATSTPRGGGRRRAAAAGPATSPATPATPTTPVTAVGSAPPKRRGRPPKNAAATGLTASSPFDGSPAKKKTKLTGNMVVTKPDPFEEEEGEQGGAAAARPPRKSRIFAPSVDPAGPGMQDVIPKLESPSVFGGMGMGMQFPHQAGEAFGTATATPEERLMRGIGGQEGGFFESEFASTTAGQQQQQQQQQRGRDEFGGQDGVDGLV